jgi:hypothetical protein
MAQVDFEILGEITVLETITSGRGIRDLRRLQRNMAGVGGEK